MDVLIAGNLCYCVKLALTEFFRILSNVFQYFAQESVIFIANHFSLDPYSELSLSINRTHSMKKLTGTLLKRCTL